MDSTELLTHFKGREDYVAIQNGKGFRPHKLKEIPLNKEKFEQGHLGQEKCLGFYLMTEESEVFCSCLDFDDHGEDPEWKAKATTYYHFLAERGLKPVMEISASGSGAHLWLHFSEAIPAVQARSFWGSVARKVGIPVKEIYPRQDRLTGKGKGNLVRYPGWNKSRFVDVEDDWNTAELEVHPVSGSDLDEIAAELGETLKKEPPDNDSFVSEQVEEILKWHDGILARRWRGDTTGLSGDKSRSVLAFCIARELVYKRVATDEIKGALRHWCNEVGYNKSERWINLTVRKAYELMSQRTTSTQHEDLASCAKMFLEQLGTHTYFGSGVQAIDQSIDGVAPGEVCIIAGRPGHGKSALALHWLDHQANQGVPTLLLSAEMSQYELGRRMVQRLVGGTEKSWKKKREEAIKTVEDHYEVRSPFIQCVSSIEQVEKHIREYTQEHAVGLVAIDYLQLLQGTKEGRYDEVSEISRRIKSAARDHNVGILALCQLSREVDRRDVIQFKLSDMKESGSIEQDADMILCGYWHAASDRSIGGNDQFEAHCIKRRNGPIRKTVMKLRFVAESQTFKDA
mgnify:FL=1